MKLKAEGLETGDNIEELQKQEHGPPLQARSEERAAAF